MYNERKDKLSWVSLLVYGVILLIIVIVIIVIIVKSTGKKQEEKPVEMVLYSIEQLNKIEVDFGADMASNMASFKYTVIDYYQGKLGSEKVDMTLALQDLYDKHLIEKLSINDVECNSEQSKVEVTKKSGEYELEFVLVCNKEVRLTTYLGKYDYCKDVSVCEKKREKKDEKSEENAEEKTEEKEKPIKENPEEQKETAIKKYTYYEYNLKPSNEIGTYSNWSNWDKEKKETSLLIEEEKKTETETKTENCKETKEETYISGYKTETYIKGYEITKYKTGTKVKKSGAQQKIINGKIVIEPIYTEENIYQTKKEPIYATRKIPIYSKRQVTVDNCQVNVDYYRYRNFTYNKGVNYVIYSTSDNDSDLLNKGYVKTGKTIEK